MLATVRAFLFRALCCSALCFCALCATLGLALPGSSAQTPMSWGDNQRGQLGIGDFPGIPRPTLITGVKQVSAGNRSLAVKTDGTVWAWGDNGAGQLSDGTTQVAGLANVATVSQGEYHNLAVKTDGTVWAWGENDYGQLGDGTHDDRSTPVQVTGLADVAEVSAGYFHNVALKKDGTVWAWGANGAGQLGDGTLDERSTPVQVSGLLNVKAVSAGYSYTLALKTDGTVWGWGANYSGQLGVNTTNWRNPTPVQASSLGDVASVSAGKYHSLALKTDGTVWACGDNGYGQLGDGTTDPRSPTPVRITGLTNVKAVTAGYNQGLAVRDDGTVWAWGDNFSGQLGDGTTTNRSIPVQVRGLTDVASASTCYTHSMAVRADGTVWAWGLNFDGQLGPGASNWIHPSPVRVNNLLDVASVSSGYAHNLAVKMDGTLWAWGGNSIGQLGIGTINWCIPAPVQVAALTDVSAVSAGYMHSLAVKTDGTVWAWGLSRFGELGDGTTTSRTAPVQVTDLTHVASVSAGYFFSLAVTKYGTVWAWGGNDYYQLGDGTMTPRTTPVEITRLMDVVSVSAGYQHSLALRRDGTVWAWGDNHYGQLGGGTLEWSSPIPVRVPGLTEVAAVSAGYQHSLALKRDGTVWAWGSNVYGQLGGGTVDRHSHTPVQIPGLKDVTSVSAGDSHNLAVRADGTIWAWGWNAYGQLGDGTSTDRSTPIRVPGLTGVASVSAGSAHSLASLAVHPPFTLADAALAMQIAGGCLSAAVHNTARLDVAEQGGQGMIDLADAVMIARKAGGLDANP